MISRSTPGDHDPGREGRTLVPSKLERSTRRRRIPFFLTSALLLAAAFASDVWTGSEVASSLFYIVAILFGAWFVGDGAGRLLSFLSVACWWMAYRLTARPFSHPNTLYWNLLAELAIYLIVSVAVARARVALRRLRSAVSELEVARDALDRETRAVGELQREMLPQGPPELPGYAWNTVYLTSTRAGGDYYDFLRASDGRLGIVVADATGHGAPAAVLVAMLRVLLHAEPIDCEAPERVLARLNSQLTNALAPGRFVTACVACLEPATGRIEYCLAGHPPPWIVRGASHRADCLEAIGGPPLGLFRDATFERGEATLDPGDTFVVHTDGLTEAMDARQELFGEARLADALASVDGHDLVGMRRELLSRVDKHRAGAALSDDLSLLLVRRVA